MRSAEFEREVSQLLARFEPEPEHTRKVADLALQLFDSLAGCHGLGLSERRLLEGAALLHDIGWSRTQPDGRGHHKVTAEMIRLHPWTSLSGPEIHLMAAIARYHRRSLPEVGQPEWDRTPETQRRTLSWLAALLRIADGLDQRHLQRINTVQAEVSADRVILRVAPSADILTEIGAAAKKGDLLERTLGIPVEVLPEPG